MIISPAYAQAAGAAGPGILGQLFPFILIFVVFYFLLTIDQHRSGVEIITDGETALIIITDQRGGVGLAVHACSYSGVGVSSSSSIGVRSKNSNAETATKMDE